jgi:hypothetical protein
MHFGKPHDKVTPQQIWNAITASLCGVLLHSVNLPFCSVFLSIHYVHITLYYAFKVFCPVWSPLLYANSTFRYMVLILHSALASLFSAIKSLCYVNLSLFYVFLSLCYVNQSLCHANLSFCYVDMSFC